MDKFGSMNGMRDDTAMTTRIGKTASSRRSDDEDRSNGAFGDVLANIVAAPVLPPLSQDPTKANDASSLDATQAQSQKQSALSANTNDGKSVGTDASKTSADNKSDNDAITNQASVAQSADSLATASADTEALVAQLAALNTEEGAAAIGQNANATLKAPTTNASALSASRSNAGAASTLQANTATDATVGAGQTTQVSGSNQGTLVSNDNAALLTAPKAKPAALEAPAQIIGRAVEPVPTTVDNAGTTQVIGGQEVAAPANDQANRAPQLTPHTIPMLAATMVRRLESGSRQFTMRLDPPELGQVEVKLTVGIDKKVRAVVSADRPEALADLVRSARELARALQEAGLDFDDKGLTFQLNDPSNGQQQRQQDARENHGARSARMDRAAGSDDSAQTETQNAKAEIPNDPFQRWQRARIALTA